MTGIRLLYRRWRNQHVARWYTRDPDRLKRWIAEARLETLPAPAIVPIRKPLSECCIALITTGGFHLGSDPPFNMARPEGDPSLRRIPIDAPRSSVLVTHDYYDHRDAELDINVVLPID
ncbi:hypothetical protein FJZ36_01395 [Candidatus Poribacteria bacterium]|nr:hypothetical protein [Candidatus Poribacteria bacterium]